MKVVAWINRHTADYALVLKIESKNCVRFGQEDVIVNCE